MCVFLGACLSVCVCTAYACVAAASDWKDWRRRQAVWTGKEGKEERLGQDWQPDSPIIFSRRDLLLMTTQRMHHTRRRRQLSSSSSSSVVGDDDARYSNTARARVSEKERRAECRVRKRDLDTLCLLQSSARLQLCLLWLASACSTALCLLSLCRLIWMMCVGVGAGV